MCMYFMYPYNSQRNMPFLGSNCFLSIFTCRKEVDPVHGQNAIEKHKRVRRVFIKNISHLLTTLEICSVIQIRVPEKSIVENFTKL